MNQADRLRPAGARLAPSCSRSPAQTPAAWHRSWRHVLLVSIGWLSVCGAFHVPQASAELSGSYAATVAAPGIEPRPDSAGLRRDTAYLLSYQVVTIGILYALPESISNWSEEQKQDYDLKNWWDNIRNPQWDDDKFWINYLAHPYWGAAYYVRARERGYDERASFWYSMAMSAAFEFGAEALFEQPSIQDLVVTPVGGVILGEYFMQLRERILAGQAPGAPLSPRDRTVLALTDPLGAINRQVQSWLGRNAEASLAPMIALRRVGGGQRYAGDDSPHERVVGIRLNYRW